MAWAAVAAAVAVLTGGPAAAHPLGPPPVVTLAADGDRLSMTWRAERDDIFAIALSLGAVAGELVFEEVNGEVVQVGGERDDVLLAESPDVPAYFTDALSVSQAGVACEGTVRRRPTYDGRAAELDFTCPAPVEDVEVTITALTEFSNAYRTIVRATDADPARGLHTAAEPTATYAFRQPAVDDMDADGAGDGGRRGGSASAAMTAAGGAAAVVAGALWVARRLQRGTAR